MFKMCVSKCMYCTHIHIHTPVGMHMCVCLDTWKTVAILASGMKVLLMVIGAGAVGSCYKVNNGFKNVPCQKKAQE